MKIGITLCLLLATTSLTGCVWRSAHYDPETGIVYGGGFDCFHRRWFNNMRDDLRDYRRHRGRYGEPGLGGCDTCGDHGGACGCGNDAPYLPRRSRHYGSGGCPCRRGSGSPGAYEMYGDGEYIEGESVDGEYFGEYVDEGNVIHTPPQRSTHHADDCPHCRKQNGDSRPRPQAYNERSQTQDQYTAREGWREVSPDEYYNSANAPARSNAPPSPTPPASLDAGSMMTIPQRNPQLGGPSTNQPQSSEPAGSSSSAPQWNPPQTSAPTRPLNDVSSMKWVPSRL